MLSTVFTGVVNVIAFFTGLYMFLMIVSGEAESPRAIVFSAFVGVIVLAHRLHSRRSEWC